MKHKSTEWLLLLPVCVIAFIVLFAHATAIKYLALAWMVAAMIVFGLVRLTASRSAAVSEAGWPGAALGVPMLLWAAWAAVSIAWSAFPGATAAAWFDEIGIPFLGFFAFYRIATIGRHPRGAGALSRAAGSTGGANATAAAAAAFAPGGPAITEASVKAGAIGAAARVESDVADRPRYARYVEGACWVATLLLAYISVRYIGQLQPELPKVGLLHFYERVGHSSTFAIIVMPIFCVMSARGTAMTRVAGMIGLIATGLIGLCSLNRFFVISGVVTILICFWPFWRSRWLMSLCTAIVVGGVAIAALIYANEVRRDEPAASTPLTKMHLIERAADMDLWKRALTGMANDDTRPMIWRFYAHEGWPHRWFGIGFGKRLPNTVYADAMPASLSSREENAKTHAHNLFLNTWLEVGFVGLFLQCVLFVALIRAFVTAAPADIWLRSAGVALVIGVLSKNLTDDFMWQSTMLAFWAYSGWLLGRTRLSASVLSRAQSGRSVAMRRLRRVGN